MVKGKRKAYTEVAEDAEVAEKKGAPERRHLADMGRSSARSKRKKEKPKTQVKNRYLGHPNPREEGAQEHSQE